MRIIVTGGSGFLGRHLVRELQSEGHEVFIITRSATKIPGFNSRNFILGSVCDLGFLNKAFRGADAVYHCAGLVEFNNKFEAAMEKVHILGTQCVLEAAKNQNVKKIIYSSSSGTIACSDKPEPDTDESSEYPELGMKWPYYRTKIEAEKLALQMAKDLDLDLVCVNPSLLIGPGDERLSSTELILNVFEENLPALPPGGLNWVDVRDVAKAMVTALKKGKSGERYLLGGYNHSLKEFIELIAKLSFSKAPALKAPKFALNLLAKSLRPVEKFGFSLPATMQPVSVEMGNAFWYFQSTKSQNNLDFKTRPAAESICDTLIDIMLKKGSSRWFKILKNRTLYSDIIKPKAISKNQKQEPVFLITGGTGCLGSKVLRRLIKMGYETRTIVLDNDPLANTIPRETEVFKGDICDPELVKKTINGCTHIIHLAAVVGDWGEQNLFHKVNIFGTFNLFSEAAKQGVHCLLASSVVVYGTLIGKKELHESEAFGEHLGPYSETKIAQEKISWLLHHRKGLNLTVIRPTNIYGPGSKPWVIDTLDFLKKGLPSLINKGKGNAGLVHVDNVVEMFILAALTPEKSIGQAFNICDQEAVSWKDYFSEIAKMGKAPKPSPMSYNLAKVSAFGMENSYKLLNIKNRPPMTFEALNLAGNDFKVPIKKAMSQLDYKPLVNYKDGLKSVENFLRDQGLI